MNFPARGTAWAYTGMALAGLASIAANILHATIPADPPAGSVIAAGLWPVFLFVAIEILAKHEWPDGARWVVIRVFGLVPVAAVSAVVSYRHMNGLLAHWGEEALTCTIGPLAVDGLLVMSTGAIIAAGMTRTAERPIVVSEPAPVMEAVPEPTPAPVPAQSRPTLVPPLVTNASDRAILDALTEPLGQSELARRSGVPASTLKNAVKRLAEQGHVEKVGTLYRRRVVA